LPMNETETGRTMSKGVMFILITASVGIAASAQILLKVGVSRPAVSQALASNDLLLIVQSVFKNAWVISGLFLYGVGALTWLGVLARAEVSYAFPFVGIGFVLVLAAGWLFLGESVTPVRVIGTALVAFGVALIARS